MKNTKNKIFDFMYNIMDYIIIAGIIAIIVLVISLRLDVLFNNDPPMKEPEKVSSTPLTEDATNEEANDSEPKPDQDPNPIEEPLKPVETSVSDSGVIQGPSNSNSGLKPVGQENTPDETPMEDVEIVIPSGVSTYRIGEIVQEAGLIPDAAEFEKTAVALNLDRRLKSGTFTIPKGTTLEDIIRIVAKVN